MSKYGFQVDVFNNTSHALQFWVSSNANMNYTLPIFDTPVTLPSQQWYSSLNHNDPQYVELNNMVGSMTVQVVNLDNQQQGFFILEFDATPLVNFRSGIAFFGSAGDISPVSTATISPATSFIFPVLYLGTFGGTPPKWTQANVMLVETIAKTSRGINPPPYS